MFLQTMKMAFKSISGNKMRSFLTMLGVIIGVMALVVLVSLIDSAAGSITEQVSSLGSNLLAVTVRDDKENPLKMKDLEIIVQDEAIDKISPLLQENAMAKTGYEEEPAAVNGVWPSYFSILNQELKFGRHLKKTDVENSSYVAVINYSGAETLFGRIDVVGERVMLNGRGVQLVGVLNENTSPAGMFGSEITLYIPFTVAARLTGSGTNISTFYASAREHDSMDYAEEALKVIMTNRLKGDENAFTIFNQSEIMNVMGQITGILSLLLGGIAAISLLVGGIGIMNIMLVSVTERTKEIGIRKAIGAGRGTIMLQFIIEALVISLFGCAIGIAVSWGIIQVATVFAGDLVTFTMSANVVVVAVSFSVAIGLLFGIYPANKAAKKNPIEALRYGG